MSAYAALVSLQELLQTIHDAADGVFNIHHRGQLDSIHGKVTSLLKMLDGPSADKSERISPPLEARMRDAACRAEDLILARKSAVSDSDARRLRFLAGITVFHFFSFFLVFRDGVPARLLDAVLVPALASAVACAVCGVGLYLVLGANNFLDLNGSRAQLTTDLKEVLSELISIDEEARGNHEASAHKALLSLQRDLESAIKSEVSDSDSKSKLEALREMVTCLLESQVNAYTLMKPAEVETMEEETKAAVREAKQILDQSERKSFRRLMKFMMLVLLSCVSALATATIPFPFQLVAGWVIIVILGFGVLALGTSASEVCAAVSNPAQELCKVIDDLSIIVGNVKKTSSSPPSSSTPKKDNLGGRVVGLEGDIYEIKDRLCDRSSKRKAVSIVGMGGIGKTTLATQVYNDPYLVEFFQVRGWVTISQEYSRSNVLLGLLKSLKGQTEQMQEKDKEDLGTSLHKKLWGRRYLIVMDDVWDTTIWDFLSRCFPDNGNGSRVLLTSRLGLSYVANHASSGSRLHKMRCLDEGQSWQLLREKVFGERGCPPELESIGKEIAKGCGGLPLAILVIGGVLSKEEKHHIIWQNVAKNLESGKSKKQCLKILALSYKHLPYHLRPCFLYFGVFLGDSEISVSRLLNLWIAEGFLKPRAVKNSKEEEEEEEGLSKPSSAKSLEEEAEDYLKDLVDRNLIQERAKSCNGKIRTYGIHDLLRDVCVENARKENFFLALNLSRESKSRGRPQPIPRRLSIQPEALQDGGRSLISPSFLNLRSFMCTAVATPAASKTPHSQSRLYLNFRFLRVLDVLVLQLGEFPVHIVSLVYLRYLAIHCDGPLPSSISKFRNLETLVHHHCSLEVYPFLPRVIWDMPNLRYIYVKPGCYLSDPRRVNPFRGRGCLILEHLQTLVGIRNFKWYKGIITRIPNLKKLGISYHVSSSVDWSVYELESLGDLQLLESLKIVIEYYDDGGSANSSGPPKLAFPQNLKKLSLSGCGIDWDSFGFLPNLEVLKLRNGACSGPWWITLEEEFPKLIFLLLEALDFTLWETENTHFPRLQRLVVRKCMMLKKIPSDIGDISTLETIELDGCHPLAVASARDIKQEQKDYDNDLTVLIKEDRDERMELANSQI